VGTVNRWLGDLEKTYAGARMYSTQVRTAVAKNDSRVEISTRPGNRCRWSAWREFPRSDCGNELD